MKRFFKVALILLGASITISAQNSKTPVSQFPDSKTEPFKIELGSSFSAAPSRRTTRVPIPGNARLSPEIITQDFSDALNIIRQNYAEGDKISPDKLTKSSLTGLLHSLDPHSNYFSATDYEELLSDEQSEYSGIGVSIANYIIGGRTETFVTATFAESPAARAGLRFGDKIIAVDGEKMSGKNSLYVREKIRGLKNSTTNLIIERASTGRTESFEIRRVTVPQPSLPDAYLLQPQIGYIDLTNGFNYTTSEEFRAALKSLHEQGMTSLVLDLRDNPGGIVEQAVKVAGEFLPDGQTVLTQRGRTAIDNKTWKSFNKNPDKVSMVVLVNGSTASASEIVTGALQDCDRAIIVGEKTFGKGLVQSVLNLPYGSGLTLTTAKYYTPSGRSIQRDYSQGNLYDYYQHRISYDPASDKKSFTKTATGRSVFGGDGILPDIEINAPLLTQTQITLLDPLFLFTRELINGRIKKFENYKVPAPIQYGKKLNNTDFAISEQLLDSFKNYLEREKIRIPVSELDSNKNFIVTRLRFDLATAVYGNVTANQILIANDTQVAKAVEALPRAENLAALARRLALKK